MERKGPEVNETSRAECLRRMEIVATQIDPVFINTPQFDCETLGDELGVQFALKVEVLNPIRSFKGRGAELLVARASDRKPLICASAGNFERNQRDNRDATCSSSRIMSFTTT